MTKAQGDRFKLLYNIELVKSSMEASSEGVYELSFPPTEKLQFRVTEKSLENLEVFTKLLLNYLLYKLIFFHREFKNKYLNIKKLVLFLVFL